MAGVSSVTSYDPYSKPNSTAATTAMMDDDRTTLSITDYFQLMAAQLANQDMTNPMSNSELMQQTTQMAMIQAITSMTESMELSMAISTQTYACSMIGKEVTVAVLNEKGEVVDTQTGVVNSINLSYSTPMLTLDGIDGEFSLSQVMVMRNTVEKEEEKEEIGELPETEGGNAAGETTGPEETGGGNAAGETAGTQETGGADGAAGSDGTDTNGGNAA